MNFLNSKAEIEKKEELPVKPSREEAQEAVRTLLRWAGDDPSREGLVDTPARVVRAYTEWFSGYEQEPEKILERTFEEVAGYSEIVTLKDIRFESYCEHHLAPIIGTVHVAYIPADRVVGISKIARLVDAFSKRLQVQEKMTSQIANTLQSVLKPLGTAVLVEGEHHCMCTRGVHKTNSTMISSAFTGDFKKDQDLKNEFYKIVGK
jgi:GTP cyclohydrolase I